DGMGDAAKGGEAFVIPLLVAVIDGRARKQAVAVMLVRGRRRHLRAEPEARSVAPDEKDVRLEARARRVVAGVVERYIDRSGDGIGSEPLVEAVGAPVRVSDRPRSRPGRSLVVRDRGEDVRVRGGSHREVHPRAADATAKGSL